MPTYNRNAYSIDTVEGAPFNPTTGAVSNIDNVLVVTGYVGVNYIGGQLYVGGVPVASGENVAIDSDDAVLKFTDAEITANFTAA